MNNTIELYLFKDFDIKDFISRYLYEINPHEVIDESTFSCFEPAKFKTTPGKRGTKNTTIIENKCLFLQNTIIRRAFHQKDKQLFSLSSRILKSVLGSEYKTMLDILIDMGYLILGDGGIGYSEKYLYYKQGDYSKLYSLSSSAEVQSQRVVNFAIKKYIDKANEELKKIYEENLKEINSRYGSVFSENYVKSLNKFTLSNHDGFDKLVEECSWNSHQRIYLNSIKSALVKQKVIYSIDRSGRLYHVLCILRKDLKKYVNIDFEIDCKNSNPLLLNYFIYDNKQIDIENRTLINNIIINNKQSSIPYHNVGKYLHNLLKESGVNNGILAKLTYDELHYIYLTSTGTLWDELLQHYPQYSRSEIKELVFQQVFFSHTSIITKDKPFAAYFKRLFPSVYKYITLWKKPFKNARIKAYLIDNNLCSEYDDERTFKTYSSLSVAMMHLESEIMTSVLKRLYRKRWNAVNIHDCIIVPLTTKKNHPTKEDVKSIMDAVYTSFGLKASFNC